MGSSELAYVFTFLRASLTSEQARLSVTIKLDFENSSMSQSNYVAIKIEDGNTSSTKFHFVTSEINDENESSLLVHFDTNKSDSEDSNLALPGCITSKIGITPAKFDTTSPKFASEMIVSSRRLNTRQQKGCPNVLSIELDTVRGKGASRSDDFRKAITSWYR